jgi:hypothetical protein
MTDQAAPAPASTPAAAPALPSTASAPQSPHQRDVQRAEAGRREVESVRAEGAAARGQQATPASDAPPSGPRMRPAWAPDTCWNQHTGTVDLAAFDKHYRENVAPRLQADAEWQASRATLPQSPDEYKVATSETFKPPAGVDYQVDGGDPWWSDVRALAHKHGLSQEAFSSAVDLIAARETQGLQHVGAARQAELAKLGPNGPSRIDAVATWLESTVGDDAAVLAMTVRRAPVAAIVEKLERIINRMTSQGMASSSRPPAGDIQGWENMTYEQRRFAQDQMRR